MIVIGLTGSVAMGKTTTAEMLQRLGVPVHDADWEVHKLMTTRSKAYPALVRAFPFYKYPRLYKHKFTGRPTIVRKELVKLIVKDIRQLKKLESVLHPYVRVAQAEFIRKHKSMGTKIVALDVPLLFEAGWDKFVDVVIVVSAPYAVQRARALARTGWNEQKFRAILDIQMPDGEKRARADYIIPTGLGRAETMRALKKALHKIRAQQK